MDKDDTPQLTLTDMSTPEHDELWGNYLDEATKFDKRIVEDWNKIVDVTLVFVGLIIAVLASFVTDTSQKLQPDQANVTNQLLLAIYDQLAAQANNTSLTRIDINGIFKLDDSDRAHAVLCNALLYSSLGLCSVAAVLALAAKLWVTSYGERVVSGETPHQRAIERQKAYSGVLVWRMEAVIQSLPLILLIALVAFGFFVHVSIWRVHPDIGYGVGTLLTLSIIALGIASLAAAFIPECPYNSSFSTIIQFIFRYIRRALKVTECVGKHKRRLRITIITILWFATGSLIAWATIMFSSAYYLFVFIPIAITFEYATDDPDSKREINHTPQKYRLPHLTLFVFVVVASILAAAGYFRNPQKRPIFITLYVVGMLLLFLYGWMARNMSKSLDNEKTTEIGAITWVLKQGTSPNRKLFKKLTHRITKGSDASDYLPWRPKILESLMPLLSRVIVSPATEEEEKDLEMFVSFLADLADFEDQKGSWWLLWEDKKRHPALGEPLRLKLDELAKHQSAVRKDAGLVLDSYNLLYASGHGEKPWRLQKREMSGDTASMVTIVEPAHLYEEMELYPRRHGKDGYLSVNV